MEAIEHKITGKHQSSMTIRILYSYKANVEYFAIRLFLKWHVCMYKVIIDAKNYRLLEQNFSGWYRATRRILLQRNDHIIRCTEKHNAFACYRFETLARSCFLNNWHLNSKLINYFFECGWLSISCTLTQCLLCVKIFVRVQFFVLNSLLGCLSKAYNGEYWLVIALLRNWF